MRFVEPEAITLTPDVSRVIREHGEEAYPFECCGALIGRGASIVEALPLPNTTPEGPRRRFLVSPEDYQAAEAAAVSRNAELIGFYHSHPDHPARPSQYDLDHAWPFFSYVIVSVLNGTAGEVTAWRLADDRSAFEEQLLAPADTEPPVAQVYS
ncbi:MAG: M67 family metallopeptidase [Acidobacteria bacterium]|nr:M67 family metallopeptidase [Acidobacteriota bacterium]